MAFTNLGDLKSAVADWMNREDLTGVIPDFIRMGVARINSDVRSQNRKSLLEFNVTVPAGSQFNPYLLGNLPKVETFAINGKVIPQVSYEEYLAALMNGDEAWCLAEVSLSGEPSLRYTGFEDVPVGADDVEVSIRGYSETDFDNYSLDTSTFTEYTENPAVYLYAALVEASIYLRDAEGVAIFQARYDELQDKAYRDYKRQQVMGGMAVSSIGADY